MTVISLEKFKSKSGITGSRGLITKIAFVYWALLITLAARKRENSEGITLMNVLSNSKIFWIKETGLFIKLYDLWVYFDSIWKVDHSYVSYSTRWVFRPEWLISKTLQFVLFTIFEDFGHYLTKFVEMLNKIL